MALHQVCIGTPFLVVAVAGQSAARRVLRPTGLPGADQGRRTSSYSELLAQRNTNKKTPGKVFQYPTLPECDP